MLCLFLSDANFFTDTCLSRPQKQARIHTHATVYFFICLYMKNVKATKITKKNIITPQRLEEEKAVKSSANKFI